MTAPRVSVDAVAWAALEDAFRRAAGAGSDWEWKAEAVDHLLWPAFDNLQTTARPLPPAMTDAKASILTDDLIGCSAPYDDRAGWRDKDFAALDDARAAVIAALTGRAVGGAPADEALAESYGFVAGREYERQHADDPATAYEAGRRDGIAAVSMPGDKAAALVAAYRRAVVDAEMVLSRGLPVDGLHPPYDREAEARARATIIAALTGREGGAA